MSDKGALTGSSPLLNLSIRLSVQDTDTQGHPSTSVSTPPESQAGYMATPTAQNTFPLLCLADPHLSFLRVTRLPSHRALPHPQAGSGSHSYQRCSCPIYILAFPPGRLGASKRVPGMAGGSLTPHPGKLTGQMTRSRGPALSSLPGRQVSCHTFLPPVLEK